jgi:hypothetical protein
MPRACGALAVARVYVAQDCMIHQAGWVLPGRAISHALAAHHSHHAPNPTNPRVPYAADSMGPAAAWLLGSVSLLGRIGYAQTIDNSARLVYWDFGFKPELITMQMYSTRS